MSIGDIYIIETGLEDVGSTDNSRRAIVRYKNGHLDFHADATSEHGPYESYTETRLKKYVEEMVGEGGHEM